MSSTIDMSNTLTICLFRLFFFNLSWKVCFPVQFTSNLTDLLFPVCTGQVAEEKENYQTRYSNWLILPHGGGTVVVSTENWTICQYYTVTYFNHYWYQLSVMPDETVTDKEVFQALDISVKSPFEIFFSFSPQTVQRPGSRTSSRNTEETML